MQLINRHLDIDFDTRVMQITSEFSGVMEGEIERMATMVLGLPCFVTMPLPEDKDTKILVCGDVVGVNAVQESRRAWRVRVNCEDIQLMG